MNEVFVIQLNLVILNSVIQNTMLSRTQTHSPCPFFQSFTIGYLKLPTTSNCFSFSLESSRQRALPIVERWPLQRGFNKSKVYGSAHGRDKKSWLLQRGGRYREAAVSGGSTVKPLENLTPSLIQCNLVPRAISAFKIAGGREEDPGEEQII